MRPLIICNRRGEWMMFSYKVDEEIVLRLLEQADAAPFFAVVDRNRAHLREWLPWVDNMNKPEDYQPVLAAWRKQFAEENGFQAGIFYKGKIAGMIGFHGIDRANRSTEIGYWLAKEYEGRGIMTRACRALIDYAFHHLDLHRVVIRCATENRKSRAVPERLGFVHEGTLRDAQWLYDHFVDVEIYSLLKTDASKS